jgi:outer membrane scaffolding protein for murein synthesis (MipA/OmpV family)
MSPRLVVTGAISYDSLQGGAKDSPLAVQPNWFSGVVAMTYGF